MAKKSVRNRNQKRLELVEKHGELRKTLRETAVDINVNDKEREEAMAQLQAMPRDTSPTRRRNRCKICGRPRGYNRLTGLCRLHMRIAVVSGMVPGMRKSSW